MVCPSNTIMRKPQAGKFIKILRTIPKLYIGVKFYDDFKKAGIDKI